MKKYLSSVVTVLTVSIAIGVSGAPPLANNAIATTETTAGGFIPSPVGGAVNPGPVAERLPNSAPNATLRNLASIASPRGTSSGGEVGGGATRVIAGDTAQKGLFGPPQYAWQDLPFKPGTSPAAVPRTSNAKPTELRRSLDERQMAHIQKAAEEGGLVPSRQSDKKLDEKMGQVQMLQPNVSMSADQINILRTFLQ